MRKLIFAWFLRFFAADILVDPDDSKTVLLAAGLFADDVERVNGNKPGCEKSLGCHILWIVSLSAALKEVTSLKSLLRKRRLMFLKCKGKWESCLIQVVNNPFPGVDRALVIAGSDRRGTAYGVFELSKQMGVSPWYYFADVP